jgi:hypothetical protein
VFPKWIDLRDGHVARTFGENSSVIKEHDADVTLPKLNWSDLERLPEAERAEVLKRGFRLV